MITEIGFGLSLRDPAQSLLQILVRSEMQLTPALLPYSRAEGVWTSESSLQGFGNA